ncbi:N-acetyltransferase [Weizmannia acidilactici]|uniref:N-acetyltransferase n=1 Tax=Weizmannia acidilactici TaxID=2607726 RepID=A0A5J4JL58_9BACI|nr:GNAT family N-acetyltransferase [Weizmannia acidilactici]GER71425.1 N-acetyltransferase [Weizmannia acidilactici]GER74732.1 N-acetyltransferase [Weizmannia acidilactici]
MLIFENEKLKVRPLEIDDKPLLVQWLTDPTVLAYYEGRDRPHDMETVHAHFYDRKDEVTRCIVEYDGQAVGYIQFYPLDASAKADYGYAQDDVIYGTDPFIGEPTLWNRGIGSLLVRSMTAYLIHKKGANRVVMDPQTWNVRAIRCYERCGFQKIKRLPKHEWHEGELRDCWLMEYRP